MVDVFLVCIISGLGSAFEALEPDNELEDHI